MKSTPSIFQLSPVNFLRQLCKKLFTEIDNYITVARKELENKPVKKHKPQDSLFEYGCKVVSHKIKTEAKDLTINKNLKKKKIEIAENLKINIKEIFTEYAFLGPGDHPGDDGKLTIKEFARGIVLYLMMAKDKHNELLQEQSGSEGDFGKLLEKYLPIFCEYYPESVKDLRAAGFIGDHANHYKHK